MEYVVFGVIFVGIACIASLALKTALRELKK